MSQPDAITRVLASIPDEVRFRVTREDERPELVKPEPKPVAPQPIQPSLFEMERNDAK